jgi:AcrR family transcriptional regulator
MADRPYHHGNLREALLQAGRVTLRERGAGALSLRELARVVGVSPAAPRRHFVDRRALLDALALAGFARLGSELRAASDDAGPDLAAQLRALARAYIAFATADAALLELMFASKHGASPVAFEAAAGDAFSPVLDVIVKGQQEGALPAGDPERVGLVQLATIQGIASLRAAGIVPADQLDMLVDDSVAQFVRGARAAV